MRTQLLHRLILVGTACTTLGCVVPVPVTTTNISGTMPTVKTTVSSFVLAPGESKSLEGVVRLPDGRPSPTQVSWSVADSTIAMIDQRGMLVGNRAGATVLRGRLIDGTEVTLAVSIVNNRNTGGQSPASTATSPSAQAGVVKVVVEPRNLVLEPGDMHSLVAEVHLPDGQINANVTWFSSDDTVVSINSTTGVVTAHRFGRTTIGASYALDNVVKGLCEIRVVADKAAIPILMPEPSNTPTGSGGASGNSEGPSAGPSPLEPIDLDSEDDYVPANVALAAIEYSEETGNGDGVPNRGERLYIKPRFKNIGGAATNNLAISIEAVGGAGSAFTSYPAVSSLDVVAINPGATSARPTSVFFGLEIADDAEAGASIPLSFNVADKFGNTWTLEGAIEVEAIDVAIALAGIDIAEESGNGDGVPNRGERLYVKPRFKNSGGVGTNGLSVSMDVKGSGGETFTSYPAVSSLDVAAIAAGGTSAKPTSVFFGLEVSEETGPGSTIPVEFRLADRFGNEWTVDGEVKTK